MCASGIHWAPAFFSTEGLTCFVMIITHCADDAEMVLHACTGLNYLLPGQELQEPIVTQLIRALSLQAQQPQPQPAQVRNYCHYESTTGS